MSHLLRAAAMFASLVCAIACADDTKPAPQLPKGAAARFNEAAFQDGSPIRALAVFPDGKRFATLAERELRVWDANGQLLESVALPDIDRVPEMAGTRTLPPGRGWSLAVATDGSAIYVLRPKLLHCVPFPSAGKELAKAPVRGDLFLSVVPHGKTGVAALTLGGSLYQWERGQEKWATVKWNALFSGGDVVAGGGVIAGGSFGFGVLPKKVVVRDVVLFDTEKEERVGILRTGEYETGALSGDGKRLALATVAGITTPSVVEVRSVADFTKVRGWHSKTVVNRLALSPSGKVVAFGTHANSSIAIYDVDTGDHMRDLDCKSGAVSALAFLSDDAVIGISALTRQGRSAIRVWDVKTGKERSPERVFPIRSLAPLPSGAWVAGTSDGRVTVWEPNKPPRDLGKHEHGVYAVAAPGDGKTVYSGGGDSVLCAWDVATGKERHAVTFSRIEKKEDATASVYALAVSPDGKEVLSGAGNGWLRVHDARDLKTLRELWPKSGTPGLASAVGFGANGEIVTNDTNEAVRVWTAKGESRMFSANSTKARTPVRVPLAVSSDGSLVIRPLLNDKPNLWYRDATDVGVWEIATGKLLHRTPTGTSGHVTAVAFLADGKAVAVGDSLGVVRVFELGAKEPKHTFTGHRGPVMCLALATDGKHLASGGSDATILVWKLDK